ncbi:protein that enables flagellar motor rotation [Burkholderiales bacterium]|jgi:chemotaxis protein MotB|nr:protein that enables flagellar motor rotation [Burkholderiales bacterium]
MNTGSEKAKSTIVIKRIKRGGPGAHGAAWKIAYADFVTAMMAFFLLMWLLGSTTKGDLKGISEYFQSPLQVSLSGGDGAGDSDSIITGGGDDLTKSAGQVKRGEVQAKKHRRDEILRKERERMEQLQRHLNQAILASDRLLQFKDQIRVEITPDGLRIQIVDDFKRPMFDIGSARVKDYMRDILREFGKVLNDVDSKIVLTGHTDSAQYAAGDKAYSNWELSADRANASRRELIAGGMEPTKIVRVVGLADSSPLDKENAMNPLNRRISIIVLNKLAEERMQMAGGEIEAGDAESLEKSVGGGARAGTRADPDGGTSAPGPANAGDAPAVLPDAAATPSP